MPEKLVSGPDGKQYIELPGGVQIPVDDLHDPAQGGGHYDSGPRLDETRGQAQMRGFKEGAMTAAHKVLTPETMGGVAGLLAPETGGASLAIPPAVGAVTSLIRDAIDGETDPKTYAGHALLHAGTNFVPGAVGRLATAAKTSGAALADAIPGKVGAISRGLKAVLGLGNEAAPAAQAVTDPLLTSTLPGGIKVFSSEGNRALVQKSIDLANQPNANTPAAKATIKALDDLIAQVQAHLAQPPAAADLLQKVGMPLTTAKDAALASARGMGSRVTQALRAALAGGSIAGQP